MHKEKQQKKKQQTTTHLINTIQRSVNFYINNKCIDTIQNRFSKVSIVYKTIATSERDNDKIQQSLKY